MTAQTSYSRLQPVAYAGLIFAQDPHDIISRDAEGVIAFGLAVGRGTNADEQCVPGGVAGIYLGISIRSLERQGALNTAAITYNDKETVGIIREGYVWAVCPASCAPGANVKYTVASGVIDAGTAGAGETQIDNATWESTTAAGELGVIRLADVQATVGS